MKDQNDNTPILQEGEPPKVVTTPPAEHQSPAMVMLDKLASYKDVNPALLTTLAELCEKDMNRRARAQLDAAMSHIKGELVGNQPKKTKMVDGKYKYAPLEEVQAVVDPLCAKHGVYYRFDEEPVEDGVKTITTVAGFGAEVSTAIVSPNYKPDQTKAGKDIMNNIQAAGAARTYNRRNGLCLMFGIAPEDDTDGRPGNDGKQPLAADPKRAAKISAAWKILRPTISRFWMEENLPDTPDGLDEEVKRKWIVIAARKASGNAKVAVDNENKAEAAIILAAMTNGKDKAIYQALYDAACDEAVGLIKEVK